MKFRKAVALGLATMMVAGMATGCGNDKVEQPPVEQNPVAEQPVEQEPVVQEPVVEVRTAASANERLAMIITDAIGETDMSIVTTNDNSVLEKYGLTADMVSEYAVAYHAEGENPEVILVVKPVEVVAEPAPVEGEVTEAVEGEVTEAVEGEETNVVDEAVPQTEVAEVTAAPAEEAVTNEAAPAAPAEEAVANEAAPAAPAEEAVTNEAAPVEEAVDAVETTGDAADVEEATVETNEAAIIESIKAYHAAMVTATAETDMADVVANGVVFTENGYVGLVIYGDLANVHTKLVDGLAAIEEIKIVPVVENEPAGENNLVEAVEGEATTETSEPVEGTEEVENTEADTTDVNEAETSEETTETTEETKAE